MAKTISQASTEQAATATVELTATAIAQATTQQFILLPPRGLRFDNVGPNTVQAQSFILSLAGARTAPRPAAALSGAKIKTKMRVVDSIHEDGAKLIEMSPASVSDLKAEQPGVRIVPVVYYYPARAPRPSIASAPMSVKKSLGISIKVVSQKNSSPIVGAKVIAFTDWTTKAGAEAVTNSKGIAVLDLGASSKKVERLYVYCTMGFWNVLEDNITLTSSTVVAMQPIDLSYQDCLRYFYNTSPLDTGKGIVVGVIDTGIAKHPDLVIAGGENTVPGENPSDFGDNGEGHGTHVAGIIAGRGTPPKGVRGIAPGVTLRSYRVFPKGGGGASNYAIIKAIDRAVSDGCDLINMSLGGGPQDEATHSALVDARAAGTLVFAANGNDYRRPVSFPGADSLALAVSAMGRKETFPPGTTEVGDIAEPYGKDKKDFIAAFSNIGPETDLTGPGVGILSTFPGGYAVMDGTSMACPAAVGAAAKFLATKPAILGMARNQARSDAMATAVLQSAKLRGFGAIFEGQGLL